MLRKKYVFNLDLKLVMEGARRQSRGNWFHRRGALTEKALSPLVFKRELGTDRRALSVDLKCLVVDKGIRRTLR